jgi:hypothetical protein
MNEIYNNFEFQDIELIILQNGLNNKEFTNVIPKLKKELFTTIARQNIFEILNSHIIKYNEAPSFTILKQEILSKGVDEHLIKEIATDFVTIQRGFETNIDWLIDQTEKWGKQRSGVIGINNARDVLNGETDLPDTAIIDILTDAIAFTLNDEMGHSYFNDAEAQYDYYHDSKFRYPCDIEEINAITQGGITANTLNIFLAGINVGKTTFLINMASSFMLRGHNVLYISAEMSSESIRERIDVRLLRCPSDNLRKLSKEDYLSKIKTIQDGTTGGLFIENYAPRSATTLDIKRLIIDYRLKFGIEIEMLIVDYIGIVKSYRLPNKSMSNSNIYGTAVAEELRGLGKEMKFPIWSAAQLNRDGQDGAEDIGMKNIADSIGIMSTCDLALVGLQPPQLQAEGLMKVVNLKNRYSNRTKIKDFVLGVNNDIQFIYSTNKGQQFMNSSGIDELKRIKESQDVLSNDSLPHVKLPSVDLNKLEHIAESNWESTEEELEFDLTQLEELMK